MFVSLISGQVIVNSSAILLGQFAGYRQVGLFGPADRLTSAILGVLVAVEQAMMPRVAAAHRRPQEINQRKLILGSLMGCYGLAGVLLAVAAPMLIPWYLGADFADAVPVVQLMGVATVITGITRTFALDLIAADRSGVCSIVTTVGAGWHLVTAALGALIGGAEGVAVAVCGTQLFMGAAMGYAIRQGPPRRRRPRAAENKGATAMTLAFAIRALRQHIVLVLITVVVVTGAGIALGSFLPKTYGSNAQILLGLDIRGTTIDPQTANLYLKDRAMTYAQLVTADEVITPVANAADIDPEVLRGRVVAAIVPETVVLDLRVTGSSPEEAVALTQALSERFRVQVSALNVQTGGPRMLPAQLSAPQPAAAPDQLHGKTLAAVSALVGVIVAVLLALLVAVIKRNRAASRPQPIATRGG